MYPQELYDILKVRDDKIDYFLAYKDATPFINTINAHLVSLRPLAVFHYYMESESGWEGEATLKYTNELEVYMFTNKWMCRELDQTITVIYHMEYDDFCIRIISVEINDVVYPCERTFTFTPGDTDTIYEAFDNCIIYGIDKFHCLSHHWDCLLKTHPEIECLIGDSDRKVQEQLFHFLAHLKE